MFEMPKVMQTAQMSARHAGVAQTLSATNMANADTPGFRGKAVEDFSSLMRGTGAALELKVSRSQHLSRTASASFSAKETGDPVDGNGNNISVEAEMVRAASAQSQHTTAMTVYKASLDLMRTALGRG